MRQGLAHLFVFLWIAAGIAVWVWFITNGGWSQDSAPLWWWIVTAVVVISGLALFSSGRRERSSTTSILGWFRELPPALQPVGAVATLNMILFVGVGLPSLIVAFLVWGNTAGRIIGAALLVVWLLLCGTEVHRARSRRA